MLRLQTEAGTAPIRLAALSLDRAVQEVAGVELHARFGGMDFEHATALRLFHSRGQRQRFSTLVEHPVVIVSPAEHQLLIYLFDARSDRRGLARLEEQTDATALR